jgi:hypothetical protein
MPRLTVHAVDQRIADLRTVLDRASESLVELDADVTRQLLEQSTVLRGATAETWHDAAARHADLWRNQLAVEKVFAQITDQRGTRTTPTRAVLVSVDALLEGDCVEMPEDRQRDRPSLMGSQGALVRCSIWAALERMSADYDTVSSYLADVANVWGDCTDRLERLNKEVSDLNSLMQDLGMRPTNQLRAIEQALADAHRVASEDPLSFDPHSIDVLEDRVLQARATVDQAVRGREARTEELADADRAVEACLATVRACRSELDRVAEKVVVRDAARMRLEALVNEIDQLRAERERADLLESHGAVESIRRRGDQIQEELRRLVEEERARTERRDELRGLLGAYRAKAESAGLAENLEVDKSYLAAQDHLFVSPCDLETSERLVTEFSHVIRARAGGTP